jgi:hypothetical protein
MAKKTKTDWITTEQGQQTYRTLRAEAQGRANATGFDHSLVRNDIFRTFTISMLPEKRNRYGRDLDGEVVMCEVLERCQRGHGPLA